MWRDVARCGVMCDATFPAKCATPGAADEEARQAQACACVEALVHVHMGPEMCAMQLAPAASLPCKHNAL